MKHHEQKTVLLQESSQIAGRSRKSTLLNMLACIVSESLLLVSLAFGFEYCISASNMMLFLGSALVMMLVTQILYAFKNGSRVVAILAVLLAVLALAALLVLTSFRAGLFAFANQLISRFDDAFNAYFALFPALDGSGGVFFAFLGIFAAIVVSELVHRRMAIATLLIVFCLGPFNLWIQAGNAALSFAFAIAGWLMVWRGALTSTSVTLRNVLVSGGVAAVTLLVVLGFTAFYTPNVAVDQFRESVVQGVETARFGSDSLPEGDMSRAASMNEGDEERLVISSNYEPASDLLLRGFVGATYEAGVWEALDHTAYEDTWTGMFSWLETQNFDPTYQRSLYDDEDANNGAIQLPIATLSVQVVGANREYVYAPSTLRSISGAQVVAGRDGSLLSNGLAGELDYELTMDVVDASGDATVTPDWLLSVTQEDTYAASEAVYRSFVEDHYLQISEVDRALINTLFYGDETWSDEGVTPTTVTSRIRAMLTTLASYTETPETVPAGEHFLSWFLTQAHEGNAAYFSTAAVLAYRAEGIPARYVEGYRADASTLAQDVYNKASTTLTTDDAHAWVEIYLDGIGWSPVEVSPGFYNQPYQVEDVIEVNQGMSDSDSDVQSAGTLGGNVEEDSEDADQAFTPLRVLEATALILAIFILIVCVVVAILEAWRAYRRARLVRQCESDDQTIAVPALFNELTLLARAAGIDFDAERPREAVDTMSMVFSSIVPEEYERIIALTQKSVFGCKELRPHEMRALRRFNVRLKEELKPPRGLKDSFARRYRYGL